MDIREAQREAEIQKRRGDWATSYINIIYALSPALRRRQIGFQRLNQLSFMQIISSCPLFIAGVVTLVMALPHVEYPVFNFGPVVMVLLVFPMALIGLLATRKATENTNQTEREIKRSVKCMIIGNFVLSVMCVLLAGASSFYSFYIVDQCSDPNSEYYELCLPNTKANIGLSLVDGAVCLILLLLSVLGIIHFSVYGFKLCFQESTRDLQVPIALQGPTELVPKQVKRYITTAT